MEIVWLWMSGALLVLKLPIVRVSELNKVRCRECRWTEVSSMRVGELIKKEWMCRALLNFQTW
jgi:hypothetical protein